jgi:hypothetical protein
LVECQIVGSGFFDFLVKVELCRKKYILLNQLYKSNYIIVMLLTIEKVKISNDIGLFALFIIYFKTLSFSSPLFWIESDIKYQIEY